MNNVATIIKRGNNYVCSECMMKQYDLTQNEGYCLWCGATFSNYSEVLLQKYKEKENNDVYSGL